MMLVILMVNRHRTLISVGLLLVLAFVLRTCTTGLNSFWDDEIFTAGLVNAGMNLPDLLHTIRTGDAHPPLYYLLAWAWAHLVGLADTPYSTPGAEWRMRLPGALLGTANVAVTYLLARRVTQHHGAALLAALLAALNPALIRQDTEARMYTLLTTFMLLGWLSLHAALHSTGRRVWALWAACLALACWVHYLGVYNLAAQGVAAALLAQRDRRAKALTALAAAALAFAPWLPVMAAQLSAGAANEAIREPLARIEAYYLKAFVTFGAINNDASLPVKEALAWGLLLLGAWSLRRQRVTLTLLLCAGPVFFLLWDLSARVAVHTMSVRYVAFLYPAGFVLIAAALVWTARRSRAVTAALTAALLTASLSGTYGILTYRWNDWRDVAAVITRVARPGDLVVMNEAMSAYWRYYGVPQGVRIEPFRAGMDLGRGRVIAVAFATPVGYELGSADASFRALLAQGRVVYSLSSFQVVVRAR